MDKLYHHGIEYYTGAFNILEIHSLSGLPISHGSYNTINTMYSYCPTPFLEFSSFYDKDFLINFINTTLDEIGCITIIKQCDFTCEWTIEYGTKPLEEIVKTPLERQVIQKGRYVALHAAEKAAKKAGQINTEEDDLELLDHLDELVDEMIRFTNIRKWASIKINLAFNLWNNSYVIYLNKRKGDISSYAYIANKLQQDLKTIRDNKLWDLRRNYIMLSEGLKLGPNINNKTLTYLLNDDIIKECSSFIG